MVANNKPVTIHKLQGIPITGLHDASNGPTCGDCAGRLLQGHYPVDGWQCPMCKRIWFRRWPTRQGYKVRCMDCDEVWLEGEGHLCPKVPTPRRREAIYATKRNQNGS